ncbi:MAG TPA: Asp-tRNA(Asn)/Glu-tRNA(Gln) amidotransferase subunit GatC [candidate division Zixibacteria bacterium]|jgi:aspartyl-tRNA(Asn)/glutamyl-tRNA(Gln) amidotransferase subunit C
MAITREELIKVARLARLRLSESELFALASDLERITQYVGQLAEVPVSDGQYRPVLPLIRTHDGMREDSVRRWFSANRATAGAFESKDGYFRVPPVIDKTLGSRDGASPSA